MRVSRTLVLGVLAAATVLLYGCSDKTIAEMSQKEMQEAVQNLPNAERQVFEQYMARNKFEHGMTRAVGTQQQVAALQPYDQVSVQEAIKLEKNWMASKK